MKAYYYFLYLIFKAFHKIAPKLDAKWQLNSTGIIDTAIKSLLILIFIIPFFAPELSKTIDDNRTYSQLIILCIATQGVVLFWDEKKWIDRFAEFDKLPYNLNKRRGLIILVFTSIIAAFFITYCVKHIYHQFNDDDTKIESGK